MKSINHSVPVKAAVIEEKYNERVYKDIAMAYTPIKVGAEVAMVIKPFFFL